MERGLSTSRIYHKTDVGILPVDIIKEDQDYKIQIVSTRRSKVMIGIKDLDTLNKLQPNYDGLSKLSKIIKCNRYYVFTVNTEDKDILGHGRMFAPVIGINEDPVTGNAVITFKTELGLKD